MILVSVILALPLSEVNDIFSKVMKILVSIQLHFEIHTKRLNSSKYQEIYKFTLTAVIVAIICSTDFVGLVHIQMRRTSSLILV